MSKVPSYQSTEEIRTLVAEGKVFSARLGEDLAAYAIECVTRMNSAEEYLDGLDDNILSRPSTELLQGVANDQFIATKEFQAVRTAAEHLLQVDAAETDVQPSPNEIFIGELEALESLLEAGLPQ
jgi:hypothetical protein